MPELLEPLSQPWMGYWLVPWSLCELLLMPLGQTHTLDLTYMDCRLDSDNSRCPTVENSHVNSLLSAVHDTLICSGLPRVTDVSRLGHLRKLDLSDTNVRDVSQLGRVHELILSRCNRLVDVSQLGHVHTLDLSRCFRIRDVSQLGSVHTLDLTRCR